MFEEKLADVDANPRGEQILKMFFKRQIWNQRTQQAKNEDPDP